MANSVGLEIGARAVRAVELSGSKKSFRVVRYAERALHAPGGVPDPEDLRAAIQEIFKEHRFSKHNVVCAVEAGDTVVREFPVPFKADDQIRKVVKYEAEHHLHDCDADDVIVQYTKVGESGDGADLLVFAARKDEIGRRIEYARGAGVEPLAMDLDAAAYYGAVRAAGLLETSPNCVLLHVGNRATDMVFVEGGAVRALRSVRLGVDSIVQGLARDMDVDFAEAVARFRDLASGDDAGDLLVPAGGEAASARKDTEKGHAELERELFVAKRDDFLARLKREYARSAAALRGAAPERAIVSGPGLQVPALVELLGERLGLPAEAFRPSRAFTLRLNGTTDAAFDAGAAVALGLALKGLGSDPLRIDFRQENLRVANKFELLKGKLALTEALLFVALLAASFHFLHKKESLRANRFDPMLTRAFNKFDEIAKVYNTVGADPRGEMIDPVAVERGPRPEALKRFVNKLRQMRSTLVRAYGTDTEPIRSALQTWNDIFKVIRDHHKELGYVDIRTLEIRQDNVVVSVVVANTAAASLLAERLAAEVPALQRMDRLPDNITPFAGALGEMQETRLEWRERRGRGR
jgi:type IV pilus assembly protein PilM